MHLAHLRLRLAWISLALLLPVPAASQDWSMPWSDPRDRPPRVDLSVSAGMLMPTDWSDFVVLGSLSSATGILEQVLVRDVRVKPGSAFGGAVTYWRDRFGLRVQAVRSKSSVAVADEELAAIDVSTWLYDLRGAIGLIEYAPPRLVWPYAFVGLGGITYDLSRTIRPPLLTFIREPAPLNRRSDLVIVDDSGRQFLLAVDELNLETVLAVNFGVGADLRIPLGGGGVGLRWEVSDHVARSPVGLHIHEFSRFGEPPSDTVVRFGRVHHLRAAVGLVIQLGR